MKEYQLKIDKLIRKGVQIPNPESIEIGEEVETGRISGHGVVIHSGSRIFGKSTLILQNTKVGTEGPVTIKNCQIGPEVELKSGGFFDAVFLRKAVLGYGSHVRKGTILEEEANTAHTVGLKQTILFPFVTMGSLINFCDCLMAGGTSRKDHSEVGSSYIHFNYTPNQDKATASLIGNIPQGVMLNKTPIFLGGQGGMVGPCRIGFGVITAAGVILRKDELREKRLIFGGPAREGNIPFSPGNHGNILRIFANNIIYIANLAALMQWYEQIRVLFISSEFPEELLAGLKEKLDMGIKERIKRLKALNNKELQSNWNCLADYFDELSSKYGDTALRDSFVKDVEKSIKQNGKDYIKVIQNLDLEVSEKGTKWLFGIVNSITEQILKKLPMFDGRIERYLKN